ncbi:MAG: helix-turn-helix transcriptional regulator [Bacteroidetes bacterium]|nr:helix-turn-helix transcriptional regulator [Bacteroidota bacterium]
MTVKHALIAGFVIFASEASAYYFTKYTGSLNYQTYTPDKDLHSFVKCYWTLEGPIEAVPQRQTIVPDGCMEMIFHHCDPYRQFLEDGSSIIQPQCFVIGQLTGPLEIAPTGETGIFSVRFHPDGFSPFAGIDIKKMENTAVGLENLFGEEGNRLGREVLIAPSTGARIMLVEAFLKDRLADATTVNRIVRSTVDLIIAVNGNLHVGNYTSKSGINRRQLERHFAKAVGISPKQLIRTIRLQHVLKMILNGNYSSLTALAYENEYYDQAHFIKDFKEFTGLTPKAFYGDAFKFSSLFYGDR